MTSFRIAASASALALLCGVTISGAAQAQEAAPAPDLIGPELIGPDPIGDVYYASLGLPAEAEANTDASTDTLALDDLASISGGASLDIEDSALSSQELTANNSNNSIGGDVTTGDIRFSDAAFANFNGVGNVVVNTGAQANIQGSINVTINGTSF